MKRISYMFILFCLLVTPVWGATIEGAVYTLDFSLATNAVVEIDTQPKQQKVVNEGMYRFEVPPGEYTLQAYLIEGNEIAAMANESLLINQEGVFVLDLLVFPDLSDDVAVLDELDTLDTEIDAVEIEPASSKTVWWVVGIAVIALIGWNIYKWKWMKKEVEKRKAVKEEINSDSDDSLKKYVAYLQKEKRVTQKDMRKQFPDSEAKISLVLTDLEAQGKIKKIKKGRGNVIVWQG